MTGQTTPTTDVLVQLAFAVTARLDAHARIRDLSLQQVRLLGILRDREPTINELAGHLGIDKSSMSGLVDRAERRGLVSRIRDGGDRRSVRVRLEPSGRLLVDDAAGAVEADLHGLLTVLTGDEQDCWEGLSVRLLAADTAERGAPLG